MGALALLLVALRSASAIPRDDDWSYLNVVFEWAEGGHLELNGWVHMFFVSQGALGAVVSSLLGPSVWNLQVLVLLFGVVGLYALYWLAGNLLSKELSVLVVVVAGLSPLWLRLSVSFMTDVPAWTLAAVSLALGVVAYKRLSRRWLTLAAVLGLLAFGVREYAVLPVVGVLTWVLICGSPKHFKRWALALVVLVAAVGAAGFFWNKSLPGSIETESASIQEAFQLFSSLAVTYALLLVPYMCLGVVLAWPQRTHLIRLLRKYWFGASLGLIAGLGLAALSSLRLVGNVIHPYGSSWTSIGDGVRSLPLWGFRAVTLVAVMSLVVLMALAGMLVQRRVIARSWRVLDLAQPSSNLAGLYVFISAVVMAVYFFAILVAGAPAFDRYLLLVVPLLGIVILWLATRSLKERITDWQTSVVALVLVVTGAFGIVITDGLNQVDGLRWEVASESVDSGIPAYKIDGGDAWFRFHQKDAPGVAQVGSLENTIPGRTWWQTFFEDSTFCRMVAIESETDLQAMYGPALSIKEERTLLGTPFRIMVFPGPDPC